MGFPAEFNWALKLKEEQGLDKTVIIEAGNEYPFRKSGHRVYPLNMPIDLINGNWEVIAKVIVKEYTLVKEGTKGTFKIIRPYSQEERKFLTDYFRETIEYIKGKKITDFSTHSVT